MKAWVKCILVTGVATWSAIDSACAQETGTRPELVADLMLGTGSGLTNLSMSYQWAWRLGQKQRLRLGIGLRSNFSFTNNKIFVTAPAKIVKGETGPGALFKDPIKANVDSVHLPWGRTSSGNVVIQITYAFTEKLRAGFNIDVIGFSFGASVPGTYINGNAPDGIYTKPVNASPSTFNLLLIGENDLGSLNSEFFVTYALNERWALKAGVQHLFIEYTTDTKVQQFPEPNDRFRITPTVVCFGVVVTIH